MARFFVSSVAGAVGAGFGFIFGAILVLNFGYPSERHGGFRIPSDYRVEHMNFGQWVVEFVGVYWAFPILFGGLAAFLTWRESRR